METLLVAARTVHFAASISLLGVFAFERLVAARPGGMPRQLLWLGWGSVGLAVVSGAGWLLAVAAKMSGASLGAALAPAVWATVLTRTRFGWDWLLRLGLCGLVALCLAAQHRASRALGWAGLIATGMLLGSLAWAGHGAATRGLAGDLHLAADIVHLLAAGIWLGMLVPFTLLLAEEPRLGTPAIRAATRRFSALAALSVAALLATGIVNTWFLADTVPALVGTDYGRLLLAKIALFLLLLAIAAVNFLRLAPRLGIAQRALLWLRRNASIEAMIGVVVLALVGALGATIPGRHSEPIWPFRFRIDFAAGWLHPAIVRAYPTSYAVPGEPYAAASIARGAAVYVENCALCHGASGRGDGPAAAGLRVRPADLTAPHLFAHTPGDLFWQVGHGGDEDGAMPGFAEVMTSRQRWDVVNFIRARGAGIAARRIGPEVIAEGAPEFPDFAFFADGRQQTLGEVLKTGLVLLVPYEPPGPSARLAALAQLRPGLNLVAVSLAEVSAEVRAMLTLFREPDDGGETEFLLDRSGAVRARWHEAHLADAAALAAVASRIGDTLAAAPQHAGHTH
jgi:putative copper resistance protein D